MGYNREKPHSFKCECGDHYWARLSKGYITVVSPEDAHLLDGRKWSAIPKPAKGKGIELGAQRVTAMRSINGRGTLQLHRVILDAENGQVVDHANRNALDNRRQNLRLTGQRMNTTNSIKRKGTSSKFKGVTWDKSSLRWRASIEIGGKRVGLGSYIREEDAGAAYMVRALEEYKQYARFE